MGKLESVASPEMREVVEGIRLSEESLPSRAAALRDSISLLKASPAAAAGLIRLLPKAEARDLEEFFASVVRFAPLLESAVSATDRMVAAQQRARVSVSVEEVPLKEPRHIGYRAPARIARESIVVVTKHSKVQHDMLKLGLNETELAEAYRKGGEDPRKIFGSHERQLQALEELKKLLPTAQIINRNQLTEARIKDAGLVIAFGGDNHMQYVSHFVHGQTPLIGCNSDPVTSTGALLECSAAELPRVLTRIETGDFRYEAWPKLKVSVDGTELPMAMADLFIGESDRKYMSRHTLQLEGRNGEGSKLIEKEKGLEQKSSGMLVVTGAGSSGWYKSAGRYIYPEGHVFPRSSFYARFLLTEISASVIGTPEEEGGQKVVFPPMAEGILYDGEKLVIRSLNDSRGIITADSIEETPFNRGKTATIEIAKEPLWTVRL